MVLTIIASKLCMKYNSSYFLNYSRFHFELAELGRRVAEAKASIRSQTGRALIVPWTNWPDQDLGQSLLKESEAFIPYSEEQAITDSADF